MGLYRSFYNILGIILQKNVIRMKLIMGEMRNVGNLILRKWNSDKTLFQSEKKVLCFYLIIKHAVLTRKM